MIIEANVQNPITKEPQIMSVHLDNIKLNPLIKYRFAQTDSLIAGFWVMGKHFSVAVGSRVEFNYKGYKFIFMKYEGKFIHSCMTIPTKEGGLSQYHTNQNEETPQGKFKKLWDRVPKEIQEIATKHAKFLRNHFTYEYTTQLKRYQMKQPLIVLKNVNLYIPTPEETLQVDSIFIDKWCWGDVKGIIETADRDKKILYTVVEVTARLVRYTINYEGYETPEKIHKMSKKDFLEERKIRPKNLN